MYTGIIQGTAEVTHAEHKADFLSYAVRLDPALGEGLELGASVAIDGICQTVREIDGAEVWFDAMAETLRKTTLGTLKTGDWVNIERSLRAGAENGGHEISGHVDGTLEILRIERTGDNCIFTLRYPAACGGYIFEKGFLAIHGASLTVSDLDRTASTFRVYLIPETLRLTNLGGMRADDRLNFEIDRRTQVIVDTVKSFLESNMATLAMQLGDKDE
ncbi:MAG: riboflavin synthase subunit alpha [Gammaproteobacteria bacterium]|nr:MAG: riboflavin synthase subunit alpha [Gammaproteobacteria bacterium]